MLYRNNVLPKNDSVFPTILLTEKYFSLIGPIYQPGHYDKSNNDLPMIANFHIIP